MKKIIVLLLAVLMLTACGSKDSTLKVANSEDAIILNNGKTVFTYGDYVDSLQYADNTQLYVMAIIEQIATNEGIDIENDVAEQINYVKEMLGDYYESYVTSNAGSVALYEASVRGDLAYNAILSQYIDNNIETLASDLDPRLIQVAEFKSLDEANTALARIKAGEQFDAVCFELAGEQETIEPYVITEKDSSLDRDVKEAVLEADGLTNVISVDHVATTDGVSTTTTTYFLANVLGSNYTDFIDDFKVVAAKQVNIEDVFAVYFTKYNFEMNNLKAARDLKNTYPSLID